jgi:predicted nucleic acid-binding protein
MFVPALWYFEVANGLIVAVRRKLITYEDHLVAKTFFKSLRVSCDDQGIDQVFSETSNLSQTCGLSVYDASYLELALRRKLPLATRDEALKAAVKKCGVKLL